LSQYQSEIETIRELLRKNPRGLTITEIAKELRQAETQQQNI